MQGDYAHHTPLRMARGGHAQPSPSPLLRINSPRRERPAALRRAGLATRRGADAGVHERGGIRAHARDGELHLWSRSRAGAVAQGRHQRQHAGASARCAWTATETRCWRWWSPPARPAIRASAPAFIAASSSRPRHSRRCPGWSAPCASARSERPPGSYTVALLDDPPLIGAKVMEEAEEVARAAREETDERVDEEAADVLYHLLVLLHSRGRTLADAERVLDAPSLPGTPRRPAEPGERALGASPVSASRPSAGCATLASIQPDPVCVELHRRLRDARLGVPQAARAGARAAGFLLESAEQGQRIGRYSFIGFRPRSVLRWSLGDAGDPYALAAEEVARFRQARRVRGGRRRRSRRCRRLLRL